MLLETHKEIKAVSTTKYLKEFASTFIKMHLLLGIPKLLEDGVNSKSLANASKRIANLLVLAVTFGATSAALASVAPYIFIAVITLFAINKIYDKFSKWQEDNSSQPPQETSFNQYAKANKLQLFGEILNTLAGLTIVSTLFRAIPALVTALSKLAILAQVVWATIATHLMTGFTTGLAITKMAGSGSKATADVVTGAVTTFRDGPSPRQDPSQRSDRDSGSDGDGRASLLDGSERSGSTA